MIISGEKSFKDIENWIEDLTNYGPKDSIKMIIGNKSDLEDRRVINFNTAKELAKKHEYDYIEVSAKTGGNIKFLFEVLSKRMIKIQDDNDSQHNNRVNSSKNSNKTPFSKTNTETVKLGSEDKSQRKCCF